MDNLGLGLKYASNLENQNVIVSDQKGNVKGGNVDDSGQHAYPDYGFQPLFLNANVYLTPEQAAWSFCLPIVGRVRIVKDPLGLVLVLIIFLYWIYNVSLVSSVILVPNYEHGYLPLFALIAYWTIALLCVTSLFRASTMNPGALNADNASSEEDWTLCTKCNHMRPPRTHHCRRCGQCVRRMDHHCPWINNCVGEDNQFAFMLLVLYAGLLSVFTFILNVLVIFLYIPCFKCSEAHLFGLKIITCILISTIMAMLMSCAGFGLYSTQHFSLLFDIPSMEWNRMQMVFFKTGRIPAVLPRQMLSLKSVYKSTCGSNPVLCWILPCRRRKSYNPSALRYSPV